MKDSCFIESMIKRRSIYSLGNKPQVSDEDIAELVKEAVKYTPSAFNSQSARAVVLLGEDNKKLWNLVMNTLRQIVPADKFGPTEAKINSFAKGRGTVLFFEDMTTVRGLQEKFPLYQDNFPKWSGQSSGMAQFAVWTALAEAGIGASLQHYNPLIDDEVKTQWKLPLEWSLMSQMPFGSIEAPADEKTFLPIDERVKVFAS